MKGKAAQPIAAADRATVAPKRRLHAKNSHDWQSLHARPARRLSFSVMWLTHSKILLTQKTDCTSMPIDTGDSYEKNNNFSVSYLCCCFACFL